MVEHYCADERSLRYRVNVSTSVKGVKTWDCTVDGTGYNKGRILAESDLLVGELEKRYPFQMYEGALNRKAEEKK